MKEEKLLVWLPSPLGDAIMCTPALRALREARPDDKIFFICSKSVREVLTPCDYCDGWIEPVKNVFELVGKLRGFKFDSAVLFKNSFSCALIVFLAGIKKRVGYKRDGRGFLLSDYRLPRKLANGKYEPYPMMKYYLELLEKIGIRESNTEMELSVSSKCENELVRKLPEISNVEGGMAILVPGGAFGPSKCWPSKYFAELADELVDRYGFKVVVSVAPNDFEMKIATEICDNSKSTLINLAQSPLSLAELKALFVKADIVVCNDTGPRHIAVALKRKVVSLFGPNDPVWTDSKYGGEIQIVADVECSPCLKPVCYKDDHYCMKSITVEKVLEAVESLLKDSRE